MRTMLNRKSWLPAAPAVIVCLALIAPVSGQDKTPAEKYGAILGTWDVHTEGVGYSFVFEFFLKDGSLKGTYTGSAGSTEMKGLTFENKLLRFSVSVNGMDLDYSAVVEGDTLTGEVSLQYGQAEITGEKRKKQADASR